jgi:hypothetical protein
MPASRLQRARTKLGALAPWRRMFPNRTVRRRIHGVDLYMPWSHVLPDFTRGGSVYGQNLIELAAALARRRSSETGLRFVDIGGNIGDSTLQVLNRADGRALCIEGDEHWARYLRMNVEGDPRVTVEEVMLAVPDGGNATSADSRVSSVADLRARHPEFADVDLIKSDTDGLDPLLVPEAARAWSESKPVLFFEFDPGLARQITGSDPNRLWDVLGKLGYSRLAVWDDTGDALGQLDLANAAEAAAMLESPPPDLGYTFWDVAARRGDDDEAAAAFDEILDSPFDPRGTSAAR